jgi:acyl-CoA synthetase (AMP-forming)/AMP-acid ligase II
VTQPDTVCALIAQAASAEGSRAALGLPDAAPIAYGELAEFTAQTGNALRASGYGPGARIAIVMPNGAPLAATVFAIGANAAVAPLNPGYRAEELEFYLSDLQADALILSDGDSGPAGPVATALDIPVATLKADPAAPAGLVLDLPKEGPRAADDAPSAHDTALLLHTSGTTSRPKLVALSGANLCASAHNIATTLKLTPEDRCLNIMPLFHIHGLIAAVLASFAAAGTVVCSPGFNPLKLFTQIAEAKPSWITAVPTMHQAMLARAARNSDVLAATKLRFLRSSSAALPVPVMAELEAVFDAPVIEAYGMTEAAHQMASNPLPPGTRKPSSVGPAAGPEIAILDEAGNPVGAGTVGEVAIRGANVTRGYEHNEPANTAAFCGEWFRTGDLGQLDAEGYLTLTGRLKEIINRGGEKISPREIDEALAQHPAVGQAVAFAMAHKSLGQDVAAAVVLREGVKAEPEELRAFLAERLADFKVPRRILILEAIPTGPTGKLQRIGLAERLGLTS